MLPDGQHHVPTPLCSTVVTRFFATTRALTPTGPFATGRGSLIHVTRTSNHSISNHLRFSAERVPLPLRQQLYFVRTSPLLRRLVRTADRIEFTVSSLEDVVTDWSFTSSCSPPGVIAPAQLLSVTGSSVSARSGTLTLLFKCAFRRTERGTASSPSGWPRWGRPSQSPAFRLCLVAHEAMSSCVSLAGTAAP